MDWLQQGPDIQTKFVPDKKVAGSVWLPGPKVCRKLEGSWPDCTRQRQNFTLFTKRDRIWCCLAQSGQLPSIFLPIFGQGNQIEPAIFCLAPSGMISSGCLGFGVARALACHHLTGFFRHPGVLKVPTFLVFTLSFEFFLLVSF